MPDNEEISKSWDEKSAAEGIFKSLAKGTIKVISIAVCRIQVSFGISQSCYDQLRVFKEALWCLPEGVKEVRLLSDTAGYQQDFMKYCAMGRNKRFGIIKFAIGCDVTPEFKKAVSEIPENEWMPYFREVKGEKIKTGREWSEVCFVPSAIGHSKK